MSVQEQLREGEWIVSSFGPYYATSVRIILYLETDAGVDVRDLPYSRLERIEEVKVGNQRLMVLGIGDGYRRVHHVLDVGVDHPTNRLDYRHTGGDTWRNR